MRERNSAMPLARAVLSHASIGERHYSVKEVAEYVGIKRRLDPETVR